MSIHQLTRVERRWARAAITAMFPSNADPRVPDGAEIVDIDGCLDETCRQVPGRVALGLRAAVWLLAFAPLFVLGKLRTIGGLQPADRERVVVRLLSSPVYVVRQLVLLLKAFGALFLFTAPGVREKVVRPAERAGLTQLRLHQGDGHERVA